MDERTIAILKKRALRYSAPPPAEREENPIGDFVGCRFENFNFGIPSGMVHELAPLTHWTPFGGRRHLLGLTHLRGEVMSLIDLLHGVTGRSCSGCSTMAILQGASGRFAVPFNEVLGIKTVDAADLLPAAQSPLESPLILSATKDLWFLLKEDALRTLAEGMSSVTLLTSAVRDEV